MSKLKEYHKFKVGDQISVRKTDKAYSRLGDISPDMTGTIKSFAPKVIIASGPLQDRKPYFACVIFNKTDVRGNPYMGGINICNLKKG